MSNKRKRVGAKKPIVRKTNLRDITVKTVNLDSQENPFEIERGVKLSGNRSGTRFINQLLFAKVKQLPVDKDVSILIPKSVAENASQASNLCLNVRRMIEDDKTFPKNFSITLRTIKDAKGQYVNARIWRIN